MRVCFSGNGQGALASAIRARMESANHVEASATDGPYEKRFRFVEDDGRDVADVAISTTGGMLIREAAEVTPVEQQRLYVGNFLAPREFTERHVRLMRDNFITDGLIIHIGSNASWYGNVHAEDYAAFKTALRKYLELRARDVKQYGIRISHIAFGGIEGPFWDKATASATPELTKGIVSGTRKMLTLDEAAWVVMAQVTAPLNVVFRDCLIVSTDYQ